MTILTVLLPEVNPCPQVKRNGFAGFLREGIRFCEYYKNDL